MKRWIIFIILRSCLFKELFNETYKPEQFQLNRSCNIFQILYVYKIIGSFKITETVSDGGLLYYNKTIGQSSKIGHIKLELGEEEDIAITCE
jgi:hypothetical protein